MASSGASLFTYFLAQIPNSLAIVDYYAESPVPAFDTELPVIVKTHISTDVSLASHCASFKPTTTILFLRNPLDIHASLTQKPYAGFGGSVEAKLAILEEYFLDEDKRIDLKIHYKDFVAKPGDIIDQLEKCGIVVPDGALSFRRKPEEIAEFNRRNSRWCMQNYVSAWWLGNIHYDRLESLREIKPQRDPRIEEVIRSLCPSLSAYYTHQR